MKKLLVIIAVAFALLPSAVFGSVGYLSNGVDTGTITDMDLIGPSTGQVFDGSRLTLYQTGPFSGVSTIASTVSKLNSANLSFGILNLQGASKTFSIDAGLYNGQEITMIKSEFDANVLKLDFSIDAVGSRTAHTGFSTVTWSTAPGGFITLTWIDSTVGWILSGASPTGVTIVY
ncbi:MAG: hypothetical protein WC404_00230 [Candidatus Omnitrophota bacterium]|jgi:hypothetical protein